MRPFAVVYQMGELGLRVFRWNAEKDEVEMLTLGGSLGLVEWVFYYDGDGRRRVKLLFVNWSMEGEYLGSFDDLMRMMEDDEVLFRVMANIDDKRWVACSGYSEEAETILRSFGCLPF